MPLDEEIIKTIKRNIESWMKNPDFDNIRDKSLDLAIIARINAERINSQDVRTHERHHGVLIAVKPLPNQSYISYQEKRRMN